MIAHRVAGRRGGRPDTDGSIGAHALFARRARGPRGWGGRAHPNKHNQPRARDPPPPLFHPLPSPPAQRGSPPRYPPSPWVPGVFCHHPRPNPLPAQRFLHHWGGIRPARPPGKGVALAVVGFGQFSKHTLARQSCQNVQERNTGKLMRKKRCERAYFAMCLAASTIDRAPMPK